ncbi:MAG: zinc ribbon domain-containing protein [Bacilli bacterium]|nr:zinc ribbon domain-containing protein [Bacilli bacterium]
MIAGIVLVISIIVLILLVLILFLVAYRKIRKFLRENFDCNTISEAFQKSKLELEQTPKSFSSMEPVLLNQLKRDFPEVNLSQLKSKSESCILDLFSSVERKNTSNLNKYSDKILNYALKMIEDSKGKETSYDSIKFHKTALTNYKHDDVCGTVTITSSLEYIYKIGNSTPKKVQDRIKVDIVYVLDRDKYGEYTKSVGVNCPNCGAAVSKIGAKKCSYCGTALGILTENAWFVDNLKQY